jgi:hypothetical protein
MRNAKASIGGTNHALMVPKSARIVAPPTTANTLRKESIAASRFRFLAHPTPVFQMPMIFLTLILLEFADQATRMRAYQKQRLAHC